MHADALRVSALRVSALVLAALFAGCSGGGSGTPTGLKVTCTSAVSKFCLASCNLGCTSTGCSITEIAQNQTITLGFSLPIDPSSVNGASFSLKTAAGEPPAGSYTILDRTLTFVPEVRVVGGLTQFGFRANESYIMTLPGGPDEQQSLRGTGGTTLGETVSCTLRVTGGIIDPDGQPPTVVMISPDPTQLGGAPRDGQIVLEFSEYIDVAPFVGATSSTSPVQYRIRKTKRDPTNALICDPASSPVLLDGVPTTQFDTARQITQVILKPSIRLPGQVCVEVDVSNRVKDLSGKAIKPVVFNFFTEATAAADLSIVEGFGSESQMDREQSAGNWTSGVATFGVIGGDGLHGEFDPADGAFTAPNLYVWNTDSQKIGNPVIPNAGLSPVTDGVFRFSTFNLPKSTILEFRGSKLPRIYVRGSMVIAGTIRINGVDVGPAVGTSVTGQIGSDGGVFGGKGGQGGDKGNGTGNPTGAFNGRPGQTVKLLAGHAYASRAAGTGGPGALQFPASGLNSAVTFKAQTNAICGQTPSGGAGGGHSTSGSPGKATVSPSVPPELAPETPGGIAFDPFPFPVASALTLDHFLAGGSGGGGGGSHPYFSVTTPTWLSGGGGGGGGGAVGMRVGRDLLVTGDGVIEAKGGGGGPVYTTVSNLPSPGGGGSGGAVVLQVGGSIIQGGLINTSGGRAGSWDFNIVGLTKCNGGDGSPGLIRLEMTTLPAPGILGNTLPTPSGKNVDVLRETDVSSGFQSRWYSTKLLFPPTFLWYSVEAVDGSTPLVFSDDATRGVFAGYGKNQAVTVLFQGARVNPSTGQPETGSLKPWREYVGSFGGPALNLDNVTGFRFLVIVNRAVASNLTVRKLTVSYRE